MRVKFQILDEDEPLTIGYKFICFHMIFDMKMENLRRKARLRKFGQYLGPNLELTQDRKPLSSVLYMY